MTEQAQRVRPGRLGVVLTLGLGLAWAVGRAFVAQTAPGETLLLGVGLAVFAGLVWALGHYLSGRTHSRMWVLFPGTCLLALWGTEISGLEATWLAWVWVVALYSWLMTAPLPGRAFYSSVAVLAGVFAGALIIIEQLGAQFAAEELFLLVEWVGLAGLTGVLMALARLVWSSTPAAPTAGWRSVAVLIPCLVCLAVGVWMYPASFSPSQPVPLYSGITSATPWLCQAIPAAPVSQTVTSAEVYARWLTRLEENPRAGVPEWGALALGYASESWAVRFRDGLLAEAVQQRFTEPANSVKYGQYLAVLRLYYYQAVRTAFPAVFSADDQARLAVWFANINRRAMTVEWSDLAYGWAFQVPPRGPYENQENGATLLSLLNRYGLNAPELAEANAAYLRGRNWGWMGRFRNSDDAVAYQLEWLNNAYLQMDEPIAVAAQPNLTLAFEWLLTQALPGGAALSYNHLPGKSWAGIWLLGAHLTGDGRYLWLADQALTSVEPVFAQPGVERLGAITARPPDMGSCLVYGDSGIPTRVGPLAPDKIVFRDGWSAEATYALLNLRFTGWHRYRATNTLTLLYQQTPLAADNLRGNVPEWVPAGRTLFRDKRVPRENLNGLVIPRTGLGAILYVFTGLGSPWAQDPPLVAEVEQMTFDSTVVHSQTSMTWRDWRQQRQVWFYPAGGPLVVVDVAEGPANHAAVTWNLPAGTLAHQQPQAVTLALPAGGHFTQFHLLADMPLAIRLTTSPTSADLNMVAQSTQPGVVRTVSVFMPVGWQLNAEPLQTQAGQVYVHLHNRQTTLAVPVWASP